VVLVGGVKTVNNVNVAAGSLIKLTSQSDGGTPGWIRVSARVVGTSFTITSSSATDTSNHRLGINKPIIQYIIETTIIIFMVVSSYFLPLIER